MLDLSPYFRPGQVRTDEDGTTSAVQSEWVQCSPMQCARSNFAMIALNNMVYVYGGISGAGDATEAHHPVLAEIVIERYTPKIDSWEPIVVNDAPKLAAFSWCRLGNEAKIAILGGTNGEIATEEFMLVDFNEETVL